MSGCQKRPEAEVSSNGDTETENADFRPISDATIKRKGDDIRSGLAFHAVEKGVYPQSLSELLEAAIIEPDHLKGPEGQSDYFAFLCPGANPDELEDDTVILIGRETIGAAKRVVFRRNGLGREESEITLSSAGIDLENLPSP